MKEINKILTVDRNSSEFNKYLLGKHSEETRAIPLKSVNVNTNLEAVTYELIPKKDIKRPIFYFLYLLKPRIFLLVLIPMVWIFSKEVRIFDTGIALLSFFGLLCVVSAFGLRNDFVDHMQGFDRFLPQALQRPIQRGWAAAWKVRRLSTFLLVLGGLCGLVIFWAYPPVGWILILTLCLVLFPTYFTGGSYKYKMGTEWVTFLLLGPILTLGIDLVLSGTFQIKLDFVWFGIFWGLFSVYVLHLQNFESLFVSSQCGFRNTVTWLGFDGSKRLLSIWWISLIFLFAGMEVYKGEDLLNVAFGTLTAFGISISFMNSIWRLKSPLGSYAVSAVRQGYYLVLIFELAILVRCVF